MVYERAEQQQAAGPLGAARGGMAACLPGCGGGLPPRRDGVARPRVCGGRPSRSRKFLFLRWNLNPEKGEMGVRGFEGGGCDILRARADEIFRRLRVCEFGERELWERRRRIKF